MARKSGETPEQLAAYATPDELDRIAEVLFDVLNPGIRFTQKDIAPFRQAAAEALAAAIKRLNK